MIDEKNEKQRRDQTPSNKDQQAVDKAAGEERGKADQVTTNDLKGKKVDADPDYEQPIRQLP